MFVQVVHDVVDPGAWQKIISQWEGPPPEFKVHTSVTSQDHGKIFCLWEVESPGALSSYLDGVTKGALKNTYYAVDEKAPATTLPHAVLAH